MGLTKEEFSINFRIKSELSEDAMDAVVVVLPCRCGCHGCPGWAVVSKDEESIKMHMAEHGLTKQQ